jgi:carbon storage regulator
MLILTRKPGERIHIGDDVRITLVTVQGQKIRLGIDAPESVSIVCDELIWRDEMLHRRNDNRSSCATMVWATEHDRSKFSSSRITTLP